MTVDNATSSSVDLITTARLNKESLKYEEENRLAHGGQGLHSQNSISSNIAASVPLQLLRGSVAGVVAKTIVYPFDRLKMIYQVKGSVVGRFQLRAFFWNLRSLAASEGFLSLWKGNFAAVCRTFPHSGIVFFCFDKYHQRLKEVDFFSPSVNRILAGGSSGMTSTLLTYPLDVLNTRMAISSGRFSYRQVALILQEGFPSLFRGLFPTLLGIFPYAGISFFTFDTLKIETLRRRHYTDRHLQASLTPIESLICGGIAGIVSQTATYPIDTVRKVMQSNTFLHYYNQSGHWGKEHPSIRRSTLLIYRRSGILGFYNGLSLNWIKGFIAAGVAFAINEQIKILQLSFANAKE